MAALEKSPKLKEIYWKVGFLIERSQGLEHVTRALIGLLQEMEEKPTWMVLDIDPRVEELDRKTLGWLFREMEEHTNIPSSVDVALREGLEARNELAHKFFQKHIDSFHLQKGINDALADLDSLKTRINRAVREVNTALRRLIRENTTADLDALEDDIRWQIEEERDI
jgi:hypothetical protein